MKMTGGQMLCESLVREGVDVIFDNVGEAVMDKSMNCIAYNGRYLMMGFASDKTRADQPLVVPRKVSAGNFRLCGVLLAYAPSEIIPVMKAGMGWNFCPNELGAKIMSEVVEWARKGSVKAVIGKVADFDAIPGEIQALFDRKTVGRTIVRLWE